MKAGQVQYVAEQASVHLALAPFLGFRGLRGGFALRRHACNTGREKKNHFTGSGLSIPCIKSLVSRSFGRISTATLVLKSLPISCASHKHLDC